MLPGCLTREPIRCGQCCIHKHKRELPEIMGPPMLYIIGAVGKQGASPGTTAIIVAHRRIVGEAGALHFAKELGWVKMQIVLTVAKHCSSQHLLQDSPFCAQSPRCTAGS